MLPALMNSVGRSVRKGVWVSRVENAETKGTETEAARAALGSQGWTTAQKDMEARKSRGLKTLLGDLNHTAATTESGATASGLSRIDSFLGSAKGVLFTPCKSCHFWQLLGPKSCLWF